jgi:hypothetical protein
MAFADDPTATTPTLADSFNTKTYAGNNTSQSITGVGFKPDLTWIKSRDNTRDHNLTDSVRGITHPIYIETGAQLTNSTFLTSFDTDGFSIGNQAAANQLGEDFVAWNWKAGGLPLINTDGNSTSIVSVNSNAGFSIVRYIGNQTAGHTIGHGLGAVPEMIILKSINATKAWYVYHVGVDASNPAHYNLRLQATDARQNSTTEFNDTAPTSSVFTLGTASGPNGTGDRYIAYCFRSISSYSKFGSYTGNGGTLSVNVGFQPDFVLVKKSSGTSSWFLFDSVRGDYNRLFPDLTNAESTSGNQVALTSTGFTSGSGGTNNSGSTYIYTAFKIN